MSKTYLFMICPKQAFSGNTDQSTVVLHELNPPIRARYVRFRPETWFGRISMRVELYGCRGTVKRLSFLTTNIAFYNVV